MWRRHLCVLHARNDTSPTHSLQRADAADRFRLGNKGIRLGCFGLRDTYLVHVCVGHAVFHRGRVAAKLGDYRAAEADFARSKALMMSAFGVRHPFVASIDHAQGAAEAWCLCFCFFSFFRCFLCVCDWRAVSPLQFMPTIIASC